MRLGARNIWFRETLDAVAASEAPLKLVLGFCPACAIYLSVITAPGPVGLAVAGFSLIMLAIALIDRQCLIIPDELNIAGFFLAILIAGLSNPDSWGPAVLVAAGRGAGLGLLFLSLRLAYAKLRGRQGLGLGDVKLAVAGGAFLDLAAIPLAIELSAISALLVYGAAKYTGKAISPTTRMPFGVYFAPSIWLSWIIEARWFG